MRGGEWVDVFAESDTTVWVVFVTLKAMRKALLKSRSTVCLCAGKALKRCCCLNLVIDTKYKGRKT